MLYLYGFRVAVLALIALIVLALVINLFLLQPVNSSLHSYLIAHYAEREAAVVDVGFYYMANAASRWIGTLLSGYLYLSGSLVLCLAGASVLILISLLFSLKLHGRKAISV